MSIILIILFAVLGVFTSVFVWYYFLADIGDLKKAKKEFEIFGLKDGFVPQGITFLKNKNKFLISGYMGKKNMASRVYVVNGETYEFEKYVTFSVGGKAFVGHAGGITNFAGSGFISSEGRVFRFLIDDVLLAKNGSVVRILDNFSTGNNADFCFVDGRYLWVGEFYKLGKFSTDATHHMILDDGTDSHALAFAFPLSICSTCGVESVLPEKALSLPDICQGIAINGDKLYASCSYSLAKSKIYEYENPLLKKTQKYIAIGEKKIDLWQLNDKLLQKTYALPEMSEEIEWVNDKLFVLFESASKKYKLVTRTGLNHVFSIK